LKSSTKFILSFVLPLYLMGHSSWGGAASKQSKSESKRTVILDGTNRVDCDVVFAQASGAARSSKVSNKSAAVMSFVTEEMMACLPPGGTDAREELIYRFRKWANTNCGCAAPTSDSDKPTDLTPEQAKCLADCFDSKNPRTGNPPPAGWDKKTLCEFLKQDPFKYSQGDCDDVWDGISIPFIITVRGLKKADCNSDGLISPKELQDFLEGKKCP